MLNAEADYGMTQMAMEGQNARFADDNKLLINFSTIPVLNSRKTKEEGRPIYDNRDHVHIMMPGNKESLVIKPMGEIEKRRFGKQYADWKENNRVNLEGTPLEAWTWITKAQVEELKYFHVRTVEQLAGMPDVQAQKFMGVQALKKQAKLFLVQAEKNKGASQLAAEIEKRDLEMQTVRETIKELQATVAALQTPAPKPRGRKAAVTE